MQIEVDMKLHSLTSELQQARELFAFEQKKLNDLSAACLTRSSRLSSDQAVLEQNRHVHDLIVKIMRIKDELASLQ